MGRSILSTLVLCHMNNLLKLVQLGLVKMIFGLFVLMMSFVVLYPYYFEDDQNRWLEIGIVLHEAHNWSKGLGTRSLKLWINHIFNTLPLLRVGLTTWSGNERMIRVVGENLGMQMEARIRKVCYYEGKYYDSIRMGILRENGKH